MLYLQVLGLLSIVLYQLMRESEEKWKKLSRQVIDLVLPLATKQQVRRSSGISIRKQYTDESFQQSTLLLFDKNNTP